MLLSRIKNRVVQKENQLHMPSKLLPSSDGEGLQTEAIMSFFEEVLVL